MVYQELPKYQISCLLFKVSEPQKFQMSPFCVGTGDIYSSERAKFLGNARQNKKMTHIQQNGIPRVSKKFN